MSSAARFEGSQHPAALDEHDYVPVVLTRQGERLALRETDESIKHAMTPLFVVHPIDRDLDTGAPKRTVQEHVHRLADQLLADWGKGSAFLDLQFLGPAPHMDDGTPVVRWMAEYCAAAGLTLSPAYSASQGDVDRQNARDVASDVNAAITWRLPISDWADLGTGLGDGRIARLLEEAARPPSEIHVLIDLSDQVSTPPELSASAVRSALRALTSLGDWRSVVLLGTGMPIGTAEIGPNGTAELGRSGWLLWRLLRTGDHRVPTFGDYCVQHPNPMSDFDPRMMQSSAQLRYTISKAWFVARGKGVRSSGTAQIRRLAQQVVDHDHYSGRDFSWGDEWLHDCANGVGSAGNQMIWRKVTTNHHLTFVVKQLATLYGT